MKISKATYLLAAILSVGVLVLPHSASGNPFTITEILPGNEGNTVGLRLSAGVTGAVKSILFTQKIKDGKATFELKGEIPIAGSGGSATIPVNNWTDWEQFLVFPDGALLPIGSGVIAVVGEGVQANLEVGFAGTSSPYGFSPWGDTLLANAGLNVPIYLPDFLSDINGDNQIDASDELYVAVNTSAWSSSSLSASALPLGSTFSISGGQGGVPDLLLGYFFSTTPISLDPDLGFTGSPLPDNKTVFVVANHSSAAVPEPSTIGLTLVAAMLFGLHLRKQKY